MRHFLIHRNFRLEGQSFASTSDLIDYVRTIFPEHYAFLSELFNDKGFITAKTSGSTGTPKIIKIEKKYLSNSAQKTIDFFNLKPQTKALLNLSSDFIAGKLMWIRALSGGWHLDICAPDHKSIAQKLENKSYDFGAMVPLQVAQNLPLIHKIKQLIIGGGQTPESLKTQLKNLSNHIYATYGMTETLTHIAVMPLNDRAKQKFIKENHPIDAYSILNGIKISTDERHCLIIEAPDIFKGIVKTNDVVALIDSKHFRWLGRYDNIINSGGIKLIPEQIENTLKNILDFEFFIAGLPDDKLGQKVVMVIESDYIPDDLQEKMKKLLSKYETPKKIYAIQTFERTSTGKIQRQKTLSKLTF